jgi:hypothetical protein
LRRVIGDDWRLGINLSAFSLKTVMHRRSNATSDAARRPMFREPALCGIRVRCILAEKGFQRSSSPGSCAGTRRVHFYRAARFRNVPLTMTFQGHNMMLIIFNRKMLLPVSNAPSPRRLFTARKYDMHHISTSTQRNKGWTYETSGCDSFHYGG